MKNSEIEFHSGLDSLFAQTIDMSPGSSKSLFESPIVQSGTAASDTKGLLSAFERVVSGFESSHALNAGSISNQQSEGRFDLERAFATASQLNLEAVPALEY
jgi:isoaspartyl peptidase/L-asparaginase-like protein (Ntn-hydrolase superfamily)